MQTSFSMAVLQVIGTLRTAEGQIHPAWWEDLLLARLLRHNSPASGLQRSIQSSRTPIYLEFPSKALICLLLLALIIQRGLRGKIQPPASALPLWQFFVAHFLQAFSSCAYPASQKGPEILGQCAPTVTFCVTVCLTIRKQLLMITIICYCKQTLKISH